MCTDGNKVLICDAVEAAVAVNRSFTAYDITCIAQDNGATERHNQMKNQVHALWSEIQSDGDYERTLIHIPGKGTAWLYHPKGSDISLYTAKLVDVVADAVNTGDSNDGPQVSVLVQSPSTGIKHLTKFIQTPDKEGRLYVGPKILSQIGLQPDDHVMVAWSTVCKTIILSKQIDRGCDTVDYQYDVNGDGRIRLSKHMVAKLGRPTDDFVIGVEGSPLMIIKIMATQT